jgi:hypothetical protein
MHKQKLVHIAGRTLMVHGGLTKMMTTLIVEEINGQVESMIADHENWLNNANDGPCWDRSLVGPIQSSELCGRLEYVLNHFDVDRMIVGHNPQSDIRVHNRCGSRLILADIHLFKGDVGGVELIKQTNSEYEAFAIEVAGRRSISLLSRNRLSSEPEMTSNSTKIKSDIAGNVTSGQPKNNAIPVAKHYGTVQNSSAPVRLNFAFKVVTTLLTQISTLISTILPI